MNWFQGLVVYVILWWLVLFTVLPWGNRTSERPERGHEAGAPSNPRLLLKFAVTTGVAAVLFLVVWGIIDSDLISFRPA